jgi:uncharacterized protein YceH (UPF0502 family)
METTPINAQDESNRLLLTEEEVRVLGCLMEKESTTPDTYPLSLNALLLACNQKTNRHPVVEYDEDTVAEAIQGLRAKQLVYRMDGSGMRVPKYRHRLDEWTSLTNGGKALLAVLLLRGLQTLGELRSRSERMFAFTSIESVEAELAFMAEHIEHPLWIKLPPAPGQKEARYAHLLCGPVAAEAFSSEQSLPEERAIASAQARGERMDRLEAKVASMEQTLAELKESFEQFRKQFE